jgi:energy-coupling factor transporter ATP-binding protein EcfA2/ribosomal protein L37AE/L43A
MRGQRLSAEEVQNQLLRLGLDREQMRRPIGALSGGQERRVRTAAALVTNPGLLLLDEPDSGLDHRRQVELMRLLRMVSNRGCTILMVSHGHLSLLEHCDGVVYLRDTGDDDVVQELRRLCHRVEIVDPPRPAIVTAESNQDLNSPAPQTMSRRAPRTRIWKQVLVELKWQCLSLMKRELQLCLREPEWRLVTPLVIALIFALTVGLSAGVESLDQPLLGFLAVLSSLWMGASLSLLGITGERDVFDYERMVFLRIPPYVTAKALCFGVLSAIQTTVFVVVVFLLRHRLVAAEPAHPFSGGCLLGTGCILVLVGLLGVTLGLFLSAVANRSREFATYTLPLVMIVQIVASVYIAAPAQSQKASVFQAHGGLNLHACEFCSRHAAVWNSDAPAWMCERCDDEWKSIRNKKPADGSQLSTTQVRDELRRRRKATPYGDQANRGPTPQFAACFASYLTISRHADIALRSLCELAKEGSDLNGSRGALRIWLREALAALAGILVSLFSATVGVLAWQTNSRWRLRMNAAAMFGFARTSGRVINKSNHRSQSPIPSPHHDRT